MSTELDTTTLLILNFAVSRTICFNEIFFLVGAGGYGALLILKTAPSRYL